MLLSIVIPMYNAESYISMCLDSILHQGVNPQIYEVIIVNDGSQDHSCVIVQQYIKKHPNIKLYNQDNKGQSVARNFGMSKAQGDYIQFVDSDDFLIQGSLPQIVKFAQSKTCIFDMITFGLTERNLANISIKNNGTGECIWQGDGEDYIASHNYNNSPCYYLLNRGFASMHNLRFEEGKLCEDGMFTLTALLNAKSIAQIDSLVYFYAIRPNSTTTTIKSERRKKIIDGFEYTINYFEKMIDGYRDMSFACKERIVERRDSYVFFYLIRLFKMGDHEIAKTAIENLRIKGFYPIKSFPGKDYPGVKFRVLTAIINCNSIFLTLCMIKGLISR